MVRSQANPVSVVIPCYNQAHFLVEAIESALNQTHPQHEIIVVNDGSTDDTAEVASRYPGVRCINQENRGLAAARNAGLHLSTGRYVVFLDADDRLLPNCLANASECLSAHPECALAFGRCRAISESGDVIPSSSNRYAGTDYYMEFLRRNRIEMPAMAIYDREVVTRIGGFRDRIEAGGDHTSIAGAEDYDLYLRITKEFPVCHHDNVVAEYRQHDASMSSDSALMLRSVSEVLRAQRAYVETNPQYREAYKSGYKLMRSYYGEFAVNRIRQQVRARSGWSQVTRDLAILTRYYPQAVRTHIFRKLYCIIFRVESKSEEDMAVRRAQE